MKKNIITALAAIGLLASCSSLNYYQVYEVKSDNVEIEDSMFVDENNDCKITYNMWAEEGDLSFMLYNKTDRNLYVVMPNTSFILNGMAHDYYSDATVTQSVGLASQQTYFSSYTNHNTWNPKKLTRAYITSNGLIGQKSISVKESEMICIPPKSAKVIKGFNLLDYIYIDCDNKKENYPKEQSTLITYTKETSPLTFRNRIAYTFNEDKTDIKYLDHLFWMGSLRNYSDKGAKMEVKYKNCGSNYEESQKIFKVGAPFRFYNKYVRK